MSKAISVGKIKIMLLVKREKGSMLFLLFPLSDIIGIYLLNT